MYHSVTSAGACNSPVTCRCSNGGMKYTEMTRRQKVVFVLKLAVCVISFGMIYPNVMHD